MEHKNQVIRVKDIEEMAKAARAAGMSYGQYVWAVKSGRAQPPKALPSRQKTEPSEKRRAVVQYDMEGNRIAEYENAATAARIVGKTNGANIGRACYGNYGTAGGYQWRYAGDEPPKGKTKRVCGICGKEFTPKHHSSKYCSHECAREAQNINARRFYNDRERKVAKHKANCLYCGMVFVADGRKTTFCSTKCKIMYHNKKGA